MKLQNKNKKHLLRIQAQKEMGEMECHKMDYLMFSVMGMRKYRLFCSSCHHNVPYEKQQELNKGCELWNGCPCKSACAIVKYALH